MYEATCSASSRDNLYLSSSAHTTASKSGATSPKQKRVLYTGAKKTASVVCWAPNLALRSSYRDLTASIAALPLCSFGARSLTMSRTSRSAEGG